jgi:hypothetical protein
MTRPVVSVVMPVRNGAEWIGASIASIVGQPIDELELVVVDDGSTDGTASVVAGWTDADPRVRCIPGPERGPGAAFDRGVEHSRADVVARMDADDVALPWRIPRQLAFLQERPEVVMVGGFIEVMDPDGGLIGCEVVPLDDREIRSRLPAHCFFNPTLAFRRVALEQVGGHRPVFDTGEDVDLALRVVAMGRVANLAQPLVRYRVHGGSVSDFDVPRQTIAVLVAQESHRRRARGESDPVDGATSLEEAARLLALDPAAVDAAVARAVTGRARMLAQAGLTRRAGQLARMSEDHRQRVQVADAARIGSVSRQRDDYLGARRSTGAGSGLAVGLGLRRAATRCRTAARMLETRFLSAAASRRG